MPEQQTRLLAERYELIAPLGRGTMGTVWRARDRALGREVAVKEIRQDPGLTEEQRAELRERMVREGRTAARINHPSVAAIHDVLIQDNSPWIIMELIEARSLEQVIDEEGPLPPRLVAEIGVDLLGALRAAHAQGITHRDVKPGNVLITETGRVVLTDFGIAKSEGDTKLTKTGMVIGSPGYTAPERARGEYTGPESDIWSLGATLYFAVEGRPAYERATVSETLAALMTESADAPTQAGALRPVLEGLLHKNHKQRFTAAKAETLLRMVADTPTSEMAAIVIDPPAPEEPPAAPEFDADRTMAVKRPVPPKPPVQEPQKPPPSDDEGTVTTTRFQPQQQNGSPGQQVYPVPAPPPRTPSGWPTPPGQTPPSTPPRSAPPEWPPAVQPPASHPAAGQPPAGQPPTGQPAMGQPPTGQPPTGQPPTGQPPMGQQPQNQPPFPGQQPPRELEPQDETIAHGRGGLGTDLFAIANTPEQPKSAKTGMLVLMAVAAVAAVVIAVLIMALLAS
ncbi:protein kinase [Nonomuraea sp. NPDC050556]|uniref:serine/threonine-protein kinase n=1 Tax=Nonomuraea sp. NPDC050556 TaxID=3364369 RepID=UPI0037B9F285